jgi:hypothetical protein
MMRLAFPASGAEKGGYYALVRSAGAPSLILPHTEPEGLKRLIDEGFVVVRHLAKVI